jgi:hypothetical protein
MLYKTKVRLEKLTDIDMYIFFERGIRGGISMISHRYAKANNPYMKNYDESTAKSYIQYLDANNLYGGAMCQKLPCGGFRWDEDVKLNTLKEYIDYLKKFNADGDKGLTLEVDLHYPKYLHDLHNDDKDLTLKVNLHDLHNDYPLAPESRNIMISELSPFQINQTKIYNEKHSETNKKLVPNLYDKKNYVCHIKNLQYYLSKRLIITKIHRVLEYEQQAW